MKNSIKLLFKNIVFKFHKNSSATFALSAVYELIRLKNIKYKTVFIWLVFGTFTVQPTQHFAQELSENARQVAKSPFRIRWVEQIPAIGATKKNTNIIKRIFKIIVGEKKQNLIRPFNALSTDDNLIWILDQGSQFLTRIDREKEKMKIFKSKQYPAFPSLVDMCIWKSDVILFTDSKLNKVFFLKSKAKSPEILNNHLQINQPTGIAYSNRTQQIWVAETAAHRLVVLNEKGNLVKYVGTRGTEPGEFNFPTFLWIDQFGFIYIVDSLNFRVQVYNPESESFTVFGELGDATGYFARPKGIATDSYGHIYIVDALFNTVQIFNRKGEFLDNFGKQGRGIGDFWLPVGIFIAKNNRIFVADSFNARIQIFELLYGEENEN